MMYLFAILIVVMLGLVELKNYFNQKRAVTPAGCRWSSYLIIWAMLVFMIIVSWFGVQ